MTKLFTIETPEQLRELSEFVKCGSVSTLATVWSATRRRMGGTSPWDGKIMVSFYTSGRQRNAVVFRITTSDETEESARLKYTPALDWCYKHLQEACHDDN